MTKKWPIVLVAAAATACSGQAGNNVAANQANGAAAANRSAPADNSANMTAGNAANAGSGSVSAEPYEASGTEPFWALTIADGQMTYTPADGAPVGEPLPAQIPIANGFRYQGAQMTVMVTHISCNNGMSERQYADTVAVTVGGETRNGCGGASTGPD